MINRVLDLQNLTVGQITIPLAKAVTASTDTPIKELLVLYRERGFSRLPVWKAEAGQQRIAGLINLTPLLYESELAHEKTAGDYLKPALYLNTELRLEVALGKMQTTGQRLAIVLGPEGAELGLVSLQDILKVIFGDVTL